MTTPDHDSMNWPIPVPADGRQLADLPAADEAESRYGAAEDALAALLESLYATIDPGDRSGLLVRMRDQAIVQAETHTAVFGSAPDDLDGDMASSLARTAALLDALAGVEAARAGGSRPTAAPFIEENAGRLLDQMTDADVDTLCRLMSEDLYDAVLDVVGAQAAEVLVTIAETVPRGDGRGGVVSALQDVPARGVSLVAVAVVALAFGATTAAAYLSGQHMVAALVVVTAVVVIAEWLRRSAVTR